MPHPEAYVESSLPQLGSALRALITRPALTDFLRRSLQIRDLACAFGLPRRASTGVLQRWLSGPHVRVKLARGGQFDATSCEVALPAEQAAALVDRVLGGTGRGVVPSKAGLPSAPECGVLAYFAARCAGESGVDLRIQDVTCEAASDDLAQAVLWPVRIEARGDLKLDLKLIFPNEACCPSAPLCCKLSLLDVFEPELLRDLAPGDLLLGDAWALYRTLAGASGLLELSVAGSSERALLALEGDQLRLSACPLTVRTTQTAELVVAELSLRFRQLAGLLSGESLLCPALREASLEAQGDVLARGRLVHFSGRLALEVAHHSMR
jgi:hypothetical protein